MPASPPYRRPIDALAVSGGWGEAALASIAFLVHVAHFRTSFTDDAFITFRYARNLASGSGMVFNPGEHVEGITNLGWALVLVPFAGRDLLLVAQALGVAAAVLALFVLGAWACARGLGVAARVVMYIVFVAAPWPAYWSVQGLETTAVMLAVTGGWALGRSSTVGLALGPWLRPDAALLALLAGGWDLARGRLTRRWVWIVAYGFMLVVLKVVWFGEVLPNTLHAKVDTFPSERGAHYLANILATQGVPLLCAIALGGTFSVLWAWRRDDRALPGLLVLAWLAAIWAEGGDFMVNCRLLVPVWPAVAAVVALAVDALVHVSPRLLGSAAVIAAGLATRDLAAIAAVSGLDTPSFHAAPKDAPIWAPWRSKLSEGGPREQAPFPAAWALVHIPSSTVVTYSELGLFGWVFDGVVVDMLGLTDRVVAGRGGETAEERRAYLLGRADWMVFGTRAPLWSAWRSELEQLGWGAVGACGETWIFQRPGLVVDPLEGAELDRRLAAVRAGVPRMDGIVLSIARELAAAGERTRAERWLAGATELAAADLTSARCDLGLDGCRERRTCERGMVPPALTEWPAIIPGMVAPAPVVHSNVGAPLAPEVPLAPTVTVATPRRTTCDTHRSEAAEAWDRAAAAWQGGRRDDPRRTARRAGADARVHDPGWLNSAREARAAAIAAASDAPSAAAASEEAWSLSEAAALCSSD